jgi:hypothetical protein
MPAVFHYQEGTLWPSFFNENGQPKTSSDANSSEGNTDGIVFNEQFHGHNECGAETAHTLGAFLPTWC